MGELTRAAGQLGRISTTLGQQGWRPPHPNVPKPSRLTLVAEQARRQAQVERETAGRVRRGLADALITSVHDAWFQELKRGAAEEEVEGIDARCASEAARARRACVYRVTQIATRGFGGGHG